MAKLGLWKISKSGLTRVPESAIKLESRLEDWIEEDPSLIQAGPVIISRQVSTPAGPIDLLALDSQGRWVLIEIKKGSLRRDTIAQVIDYASCFASFSEEKLRNHLEDYLSNKRKDISLSNLLDGRDAYHALSPDSRDLILFVVGTGRDPGLERMASFLVSQYGIPLSIVTFQVLEDSHGQAILARELSEPKLEELPAQSQRSVLVEDVCRQADHGGIRKPFRRVLQTATSLGLYPRAWKTSIMYTPPANKTRMLFTVWAKPTNKRIKAYVGNTVFTEFYDVSISQVKKAMGPEGWRYFPTNDIDKFLSGLISLMASTKST